MEPGIILPKSHEYALRDWGPLDILLSDEEKRRLDLDNESGVVEILRNEEGEDEEADYRDMMQELHRQYVRRKQKRRHGVVITTLYKRKADKIRPVDSSEPAREGLVDCWGWREKAIRRQRRRLGNALGSSEGDLGKN